MGILLRESRPSTLSYDGYLKLLYWLKLFGFFKRSVGGGGGGEVLIVKLDNSPLKSSNSAIFFAM